VVERGDDAVVGADGAAAVRLTAWVEGRVQGVGFRWWVRASALELGLAGYAENLSDGRVKVVAEGAEPGCRELLGRLDAEVWPRRPGRVSRVTYRWAQAGGTLAGFAAR
jgi:acylphosphatase